ncbi:uncharacterized protein LOC126900497 [Daktulosphaira vitifoliae]|uniref:uncharacterized protein LOC126900497 n=1 Tax=Daktulosphaira vitifoliae TaxID=58002 RepID=UPI0021AA3170|nr:uncharacterized protein LOC126900497 [Daktulosphaira vitifoliae]
MTFITILTILLLNFTLENSAYNERRCNFSRYMLNYFKLNEKYLLHFYNNLERVTEEDLRKYDKAVQSHSDIILLMIQELYVNQNIHFPSDLMAVNMYLNNISGSIIVINKNEAVNDEAVKNNKVLLSLQGLKLLNHSMIIGLDSFIKYNCIKEPISLFVQYPIDLIPTHILNIDELSIATKRLREKLMKELGFEKIKNLDELLFYPRNILFYNLMTKNSEKNLKMDTKSKQRQKLEVGNTNDVLDLLRFAPLNIKCADESNLTIYDLYRYAEYQFSFIDIKAFQKILLGATFYPIGILIADYIQLAKIASQDCKKFKNDKENLSSIVTLGKNVALHLQSFRNLNIYKEKGYIFLKKIFYRLHVIINWVKGSELENEDLPDLLLKGIESFMKENKLKFQMKSEIFVSNINVIDIRDQIIEKANIVESYIQELKNYKHLFQAVHALQYCDKVTLKNFKYFLLPNLTDNLCKDNLLYEDVNKNENFNDYNNSSEFNIYDVGDNDGLEEFKNENIEHFKNAVFKRKKINYYKSLIPLIEMNDFPKHMVDYFIVSK